ncbi:hypothetical protein CSB37_01750 [bacterium DOLZORAL124_38_8]|nr:MAG: hypothetical protein CSB37_01750 [bacterium DOLZORAL124_38_8]
MTQKRIPLNELQQQSVSQIYGPVLVLAGPGTGKTQMLTRRIEHLIQAGVGAEPKNILCLTFTESGATEMKNRLARWIQGEAYKVKISTFHGFCQWIMDEYEEIFAPKVQNKVIADDLQKALIFQKVIKAKKWEYFSSPWDDFVYKHDITKAISDLKKEYLTPAKLRALIPEEQERLESDPKNFYTKKYKEFRAGDWKPSAKEKIKKKIGKMYELADFWEQFDTEISQAGYFDFDDQIDWVVDELKKNESLRLDLQERFQWILVDEYQDSNQAQTEILWALTDGLPDANLFVVGDADQSIYKFQGASSANITQFLQRFPQALQVTLAENYRSHQNILDSAYASILQNNNRASKNQSLLSKNPRFQNQNGGTITQTVFSSRQAEICWLAKEIQTKINQGMAPNEMAILVRKNREIEEIARELPKFNIPVSAQVFQNVFKNESVQYLLQLLEIFQSENLSADDKIFTLLHAPFWNIEPAHLLELSLHKSRTRQTFAQILQSEIYYGHFKRSFKVNDQTIHIRRVTNSHEIQQRFTELQQLWQAEFGTDVAATDLDTSLTKSFFFVIETNDEIIGYSRGQFNQKYGELDATILKPAYRGQGIGQKLLSTIESFLMTNQVPEWGLLARPKAVNAYQTFGFNHGQPLNPNAERVFSQDQTLTPLRKKITQAPNGIFTLDPILQDFFNFLLKSRKNFWHLRPAVIAEKLLYESGLADWMTQQKKLEDWQNVRKFLEWVREQNKNTINEILPLIDLHNELGIGLNPDPLPKDKKSIKIMTAHKSKGMEFECVFLPGMVDRVWGNPRSVQKIALPQLTEDVSDENEEERRLFFVALTRAKNEIYMSYAETNFAGRSQSPSIFWHEIPTKNKVEQITEDAENTLGEFFPVLNSTKPIMLTTQERSRLSEIAQNFTWSASALNNYLECPRRFLFQNLYQFPRKPIPAAALGTSLHQALERFFRAKDWNQDKILAEFERALRGQNLNQETFAKMYDHGQNVINRYYEEKLVSFAQQYPFGYELEYNFRAFGPSIKDIRITGTMDKIVYQNEAKNLVKIVDYKSGKPKTIKHGEKLWRQLVFYDLLCHAAKPNWQVESCELEFLTANPAKDQLETKAYQVTDADRKQVIEELTQAHQQLLNLEFPIVENTTRDEDIDYWQNFGR